MMPSLRHLFEQPVAFGAQSQFHFPTLMPDSHVQVAEKADNRKVPHHKPHRQRQAELDHDGPGDPLIQHHTGGKNERVREHRSNSSWLSRVVDSDTLERDRCRSIDIARVAEQRHQQRKKYGSRDNNNSSNHTGNRKKRVISAGNIAGGFANETAKKHKAGDFHGVNFKSPNPSAGSPIE